MGYITEEKYLIQRDKATVKNHRFLDTTGYPFVELDDAAMLEAPFPELKEIIDELLPDIPYFDIPLYTVPLSEGSKIVRTPGLEDAAGTEYIHVFCVPLGVYTDRNGHSDLDRLCITRDGEIINTSEALNVKDCDFGPDFGTFSHYEKFCEDIEDSSDVVYPRLREPMHNFSMDAVHYMVPNTPLMKGHLDEDSFDKDAVREAIIKCIEEARNEEKRVEWWPELTDEQVRFFNEPGMPFLQRLRGPSGSSGNSEAVYQRVPV